MAFGQILLDAGIAAFVVSNTGATESPFIFMFSLAIVSGSIILYRTGAIFSVVLAAGGYLIVATVAGAVTRANTRTLLVHLAALVIIAALAGYLSELLRRTGERLEASELDLAAITAIHEALVQSVASGLLTTDRFGVVTFVNRAGEQITGLSADEVRGKPAAVQFPFIPVAEGRGEAPYQNARGERLHLGFTVSSLRDRAGAIIGRAVIFQDLTKLKAMEETIQRSERLADLGKVAAGLAHELRNPLASMSGSVELLANSGGINEEERRLMDIVLREAARLNGLVTSFLDYARPVPPRRERADVAVLLGETLDVFAHDPAGQKIRIERQLVPAMVAGDPSLLRQVLWNLLLNAAQAMTDDGGGRENTIRASCGPDPRGGARIAICDTGIGIDAADVPRLFLPFFTTKDRGTGLGLATVHRIIDAHGGEIAVNSEPGQGSTFTIWLPEGTDDGDARRPVSTAN
jgi:two-component system sensor histidine kinase PilS (NtrC family)